MATVSSGRLNDLRRQWLEESLSRSCDDGVLSREQVARILGQFETPEESLLRITNGTAFGIVGAAAVLLACAAGFLAEHFDEWLTSFGVLGLFCTAISAMYLLAWRFRARQQFKAAELWLFFGASLFVTAVFALLDTRFTPAQLGVAGLMRADRVLVIGLMPLAIFTRSSLLHLLAVVAVGMMGYYEASLFATKLTWHSHLIPLCLLPAFLYGYREAKADPAAKAPALLVGLALTIAGLWPFAELSSWSPERYWPFVFGFEGVTLLLLAELHYSRRSLMPAYRMSGLLFVGVALTYLGMATIWGSLGHALDAAGTSAPVNLANVLICQAFACITLVTGCVVVVSYCRCRRDQDEPLGQTARTLAGQLWFPTTLLAVMLFLTLWHCASPAWLGMWVVPIELANLTSLVVAVYLLDTALREEQPYLLLGAGACCLKVLYTTVANQALGGGQLSTGITLACFAVALLAMSAVWRIAKPRVPLTIPEPPAPPMETLAPVVRPAGRWRTRLATVRGRIKVRPGLLQLVAILVQLGVLVRYGLWSLM